MTCHSLERLWVRATKNTHHQILGWLFPHRNDPTAPNLFRVIRARRPSAHHPCLRQLRLLHFVAPAPKDRYIAVRVEVNNNGLTRCLLAQHRPLPEAADHSRRQGT